MSDFVNEKKSHALKNLNRILNGELSEHTGWLEPLTNKEIEEIKSVSDKIRKQSDVLVVIGVGGSYLGSRAVIEAMSNPYNREKEVIYLGNSLSAIDLKQALDYLEYKRFSVNVISKSGTTMEPSIAFNFVKELLIKKYGSNAYERIYVTTDESKGELREFADKYNVKSLVIPDDVGGRFSVLTAVGLLPIAFSGSDIDSLILGARESFSNAKDGSDKIAINYPAMRSVLYSDEYNIEILATYEPRLSYLGEWWEQLFGESQGKDGKGIFPSSATFTTDLHSLGQLIQEGERNIFETHLITKTNTELIIESKDEVSIANLDGHSLEYVNEKASEATIDAHFDGDVPCIKIDVGELNEYNIGKLMHEMMLSCAVSSLSLGVNPFDQPGVEAYKNNIKKIFNK